MLSRSFDFIFIFVSLFPFFSLIVLQTEIKFLTTHFEIRTCLHFVSQCEVDNGDFKGGSVAAYLTSIFLPIRIIQTRMK